MQRTCRRSLATIAVLLSLGMGHMLPASAADIWVTALVPDVDPTDGKCSLIEAIENANADARVNADCQAGNGADTIHLQKTKVYTLTKPIYDTATNTENGLPVIRSKMLIDGRGSVIERKQTDPSKIHDTNGNILFENVEPAYRLFETVVSGDLEIRNATLRGGGVYWSALGPGGEGYGIGWYHGDHFYGTISGGAIHNSGKVTLRNVDSSSAEGGTPSLFNDSNATMVISNSTLSGGYSALYNEGALTLRSSNVQRTNEGLFLNGGISTIEGCNLSGLYYAIVHTHGELTIKNSLIERNYRAIRNSAGPNAGNLPGMSIVNSTISGNGLAIQNSGNLELTNNIISGNYGYAPFGPVISNDGTISSNNNILGDNSKCFSQCADTYYYFSTNYKAWNFTPSGTDIVATIDGNRPTALSDIVQTTKWGYRLIGYAADNGGPTKTVAIVAGSPALDAADSSKCPPTDQRGVARPQGAGCDIGAFELEVPSLSQLSVSDQTVSENAGTASVVVTLSPASTDTVTVNFATKPGTALAGQDYRGKSGTLTFNPGDTTKTVAVKIINDTVPEPTESFSVQLSSPVNAAIADGVATVTINDDDAAGPVSLRVQDLTVPENVGTANIKVTLNHASTQTVTVAYVTNAGTALANKDYRGTSGTLTFTPGQTAKTIPVKIINDTVPEPTEYFTMKLKTPVNATIADGLATVTITDGD